MTSSLVAFKRVLQPEFTQRNLCLVYFLGRGPLRGGNLHSKRQLQAGSSGELRQHLRIEVHPLLVRDISAPHETGNVRGRVRGPVGRWRADWLGHPAGPTRE